MSQLIDYAPISTSGQSLDRHRDRLWGSAVKSIESLVRARPARIGPLAATLALIATMVLAGCSSSSSAEPVGSTSIADSAGSTPAITSAGASTPASSAAAGALTGLWTGTYESAARDDTGTIKATFAEVGNSLTGELTTDSVCFTKGTLTGTISGTNITLVAMHGSETLTLTSSMSSSHDRNFRGTYQGATHCGNGQGTFELGHTG
jgi:hypothetical protein